MPRKLAKTVNVKSDEQVQDYIDLLSGTAEYEKGGDAATDRTPLEGAVTIGAFAMAATVEGPMSSVRKGSIGFVQALPELERKEYPFALVAVPLLDEDTTETTHLRIPVSIAELGYKGLENESLICLRGAAKAVFAAVTGEYELATEYFMAKMQRN